MLQCRSSVHFKLRYVHDTYIVATKVSQILTWHKWGQKNSVDPAASLSAFLHKLVKHSYWTAISRLNVRIVSGGRICTEWGQLPNLSNIKVEKNILMEAIGIPIEKEV